MPTINLKQNVYDELQEIMVYELKEKLKSSDPKEALLEIVKNKFGVTPSAIILKTLKEYKKNHKIK